MHVLPLLITWGTTTFAGLLPLRPHELSSLLRISIQPPLSPGGGNRNRNTLCVLNYSHVVAKYVDPCTPFDLVPREEWQLCALMLNPSWYKLCGCRRGHHVQINPPSFSPQVVEYLLAYPDVIFLLRPGQPNLM